MKDIHIHIEQSQHHHQRIATRHTIDAIHKIADIHHAHTRNRKNEDNIQRRLNQSRMIKHQYDGDKLAN